MWSLIGSFRTGTAGSRHGALAALYKLYKFQSASPASALAMLASHFETPSKRLIECGGNEQEHGETERARMLIPDHRVHPASAETKSPYRERLLIRINHRFSWCCALNIWSWSRTIREANNWNHRSNFNGKGGTLKRSQEAFSYFSSQ